MKKFTRLLATVLAFALSAQCIALAADSQKVFRGVISAAEYDTDSGQALLAGEVAAANSLLTIEVFKTGTDVDALLMQSVDKIMPEIVHLQQVNSDGEGRYEISWSFPEAAPGKYPVRIFSAAEDRIYTAELNIGEAEIERCSTEHWYEDADGNKNPDDAEKLVIRTRLKEKSGAGRAVAVIAAAYEKDSGALAYVVTEPAKAFGNAETDVTMKIPVTFEKYHIKTFVWRDLNGMANIGAVSEFDADALIAPDGEKLYSDMLTHLGGVNVHPRVISNAAEFAEAAERIETNDVMKKEFSQIAGALANYDKQKLTYVTSTGGSMLSTARLLASCAKDLGGMYLLTGDEQYAEKLWTKVETCMNFPDWNPYEFLDVGEMAFGFAVAYDRLYNWLTAEQKQQMAAAVANFAFDPILDDYYERSRTRSYYWSRKENSNNWNLVCNGGVMTAALAFMDEPTVGEKAKEVLTEGMKNIRRGLELYSDGEWEEGVTYWCYASKYLAYFTDTLERTVGTTYGYADAEGVKDSIGWVMAMQGPTMPFNFGETEDNINSQSNVYWFGSHFGDRNMTAYARSLMQNYAWSDVYELLKYDGSFENAPVEYPEDFFGEKLATVTMRSGSTSSDTFVGFHNGKNGISHAQLDAGTFVIDSQGKRFVKDLGKDSYDLPKWNCYRNRAEGHNTLVINPSAEVDQYLDADCKLTDYGRNGDVSYAIGDLTSAYRDSASSVKRGVMLTDNRSTVIVRDEISLKKPSELYWFAHTDASITVSSDKKSAVLAIGGKYMQAKILSDAGTFEVSEPKPLSTSPNPSGQATNTGKKLTIHLTDFTSGTIEVGFAPISSAGAEYAFVSPGALASWK